MKKMKAVYRVAFIFFSALLLSSAHAAVVSDEAKRFFDRGLAAVEMAKTPADYESAIREFEKAKSLAPNWAYVYYNLGLLLEKTGNYDGAIQNLQNYLRLAPPSTDTDQVRRTIHKLEYKRDRTNIEGIWRVDMRGMWDKVACKPNAYMHFLGGMLGSTAVIADIHLEFRKTGKGFEARVLSSKSRFPNRPDGPYVSVVRNGLVVNIYDAIIYACDRNVDSNNCPWTADFNLTHVAADALEGTIKIVGIAHQIDIRTARHSGAMGLVCDGTVVLRRIGIAR